MPKERLVKMITQGETAKKRLIEAALITMLIIILHKPLSVELHNSNINKTTGDNAAVYGNNNPHVHKKCGTIVMVMVMMAVVMVVMIAMIAWQI